MTVVFPLVRSQLSVFYQSCGRIEHSSQSPALGGGKVCPLAVVLVVAVLGFKQATFNRAKPRMPVSIITLYV
jgi:hypothetical protein